VPAGTETPIIGEARRLFQSRRRAASRHCREGYTMRIALAADHHGYLLRRHILERLAEQGHEVVDRGTDSPEPTDYPDAARDVAGDVIAGRAERGIVICGSGAGVSIAANKFPGIRAAAVSDTFTAHQCVEHDDVNVLCLGAETVGRWLALDIVDAFVGARFTGEQRHRRRVGKIEQFERRLRGED
jgi:ribose 5-phosphate isomerase B